MAQLIEPFEEENENENEELTIGQFFSSLAMAILIAVVMTLTVFLIESDRSEISKKEMIWFLENSVSLNCETIFESEEVWLRNDLVGKTIVSSNNLLYKYSFIGGKDIPNKYNDMIKAKHNKDCK